MKQQKIKIGGFTLIELLVVISIVSLLGSLTLASLNIARAKARDARILVDVRSIVTALDLYYNDFGEYPPFRTSVWWWFDRMAGMYGESTSPILKNALTPYLSAFPNPGTVTTPRWKWGQIQSRISYSRPYWSWAGSANNLIRDTCFSGINSWGETGKCYILYVITETDTPLGPANTPISLLNGKTVLYPYPGYDPDAVWWGFW